MAQAEGKLTSYQVINAALNDKGRVSNNEAQSIELATFRLLCAQPDNVAIGYPMFKVLQKLPQELRDQLPAQVKEQCAKFEKVAVAATGAMFTMSAPRTSTPAQHPLKEQLVAKVEDAKKGPNNGPSFRT